MAKAAQQKKPAISNLVVHECAQSSPEWYAARLGKATASNFAAILASGEQKGRTTLMRKLAGEIMTGEPQENYSSKEMEKGKELEPEIRDWYSRTKFADVKQVGFIFNPEINAGWSPDGLIGDDGAIELKWHTPHVMISVLEKGTFPTEHLAQVQGALWVGRRQWIDYVAFSHQQIPKYVCRMTRNEGFIKELSNAVEIFNWDLAQLLKKIRSMGAA